LYSRTWASQPCHIVLLTAGTSNHALSNNICHRTGLRYLHLPTAPSKQVHHTWISLIYEDFITFYEVNSATPQNCILFAEFVGLESTRIRQYKYFIAFLFHLYSTYFLDYGSRPYGPRIPKAYNPTKGLWRQLFGLTTTFLGPTCWRSQRNY